MPTDTFKGSCCSLKRRWPRDFTRQRQYNRLEQNKSYLEFIRGIRETLEDYPESDEKQSEDEDGDGERTNHNEGTANKKEKVATNDGGNNKVRTFMEGTWDDSRLLQRDQVEQVARFCEQTTSENMNPVALLDDRTNGGNIHAARGYNRPYLGPLDEAQLVCELSKQVVIFNSFLFLVANTSPSVSIPTEMYLMMKQK
jgi:hypothetical protein